MNEEVIKLIEEPIEKLYNSIMEKPLQVLNIFNDFFGEERVDMQGYSSLEEFKSWIYDAPISIYPLGLDEVKRSWIEQNNCEMRSITSLSKEQLEYFIKILPETRDYIAANKFNNIFILVHFPHVRITNENDRFVDINHLWAKVKVSCSGALKETFTLNRSEYSLLHINSNYMHSHVRSIPIPDFTQFKRPCTGSGPINDTMNTLTRGYNEDIWNLFCLELSKYVTVESIAGVPYHHLESLGKSNTGIIDNRYRTVLKPSYYGRHCTLSNLNEFIKYFISLKKLKFNYVNGSYSIGMPFIDYIILISNAFIEWYNEQFNTSKIKATFKDLKNDRLLKEVIISNGIIYDNSVKINRDDYLSFIGNAVCTFKGKEITLNITGTDKIPKENKNIILNVDVALYILTIVLKILNYRYGRNKEKCTDNQSSTKVRYI